MLRKTWFGVTLFIIVVMCPILVFISKDNKNKIDTKLSDRIVIKEYNSTYDVKIIEVDGVEYLSSKGGVCPLIKNK